MFDDLIESQPKRSRLERLTDSLFGGGFQRLNLPRPEPQRGPAYNVASQAVAEYEPQFNQSTYVGAYVPSPEAKQFEGGHYGWEARKRLYEQVERLRRDDPYTWAAIRILSHGATGDGMTLSLKTPEDQLTERQKTGKRALDWAVELLNRRAGNDTETFTHFGNCYIQPVASAKDELIDFAAFHPAAMDRLCDERDQFPDKTKAFENKDTRSGRHIAYIPLFACVHGRYRLQVGESFGTPITFASRQSINAVIKGFAELERRRLCSSPRGVYRNVEAIPREIFNRRIYGEPGNLSTAIPEYRAQMGDTSTMETPYQFRATNGIEYKIEAVDARLGDIADLDALLDRALAAIGVPRAIITGQVVNFATLNALLKHLFTQQSILAREFERQVIRPLLDRALLLERILPEECPYEITWGERLVTEELQYNAELALQAYQIGLLAEQPTMEVLCQTLGRKDAEALVKQNETVRKMAAGTPPETQAANVLNFTNQFKQNRQQNKQQSDIDEIKRSLQSLTDTVNRLARPA